LLRELGDEPTYVGPIGSGCIVKLVHNSASFAVQSTIVEPFTMGVKAGIDPTVLLRALRQGTTGRARTFDRLAEHFLTGVYDPPSFALRLAYKDMNLALALAKACGVPMRMIEMATKDMAEALERGWGERDARVVLTLQEERADVYMKNPSKPKVGAVEAI
jgi:3-hydroxyisobutyrate dehydrogenase